MRDKWSLLVIVVSSNAASQQVLDFASSNWVDVAYKTLKNNIWDQ